MVTIKDLVKQQEFNNYSDIELIEAFFKLNDMEVEGIDTITRLSKSKIEKLKKKERMIEEWTSYLPSKYLYENYDLEIADWLHRLELDYLSNGGELTERRLKWAKENIPNIERPQLYFNPLVEWLDDRGIRFKDENL